MHVSFAGTRHVELPGATVDEVVAAAAGRFGEEFAALCSTCTVVVDGETVHVFATTAAGDELAILPPVSGGAHDDGGPGEPLRVVVVTVSDHAGCAGEYEDLTGPTLERLVVERLDAAVVGRELVPDEPGQITSSIVRWCDSGDCDLVLTNGGTGLSPATSRRRRPTTCWTQNLSGLGELMRSAGTATTPLAALSRRAAGRRGRSIVVNLPGSVRGATESLEALLVVLPHAVAMARSAP